MASQTNLFQLECVWSWMKIVRSLAHQCWAGLLALLGKFQLWWVKNWIQIIAGFSEPDPELEFTVINELDLKQISWFQFCVWKWNQTWTRTPYFGGKTSVGWVLVILETCRVRVSELVSDWSFFYFLFEKIIIKIKIKQILGTFLIDKIKLRIFKFS
jgi:hypothetical protein